MFLQKKTQQTFSTSPSTTRIREYGARALTLILVVGLVLPSLTVFPTPAYAATTAIRQEINLIDGYFTAASSAKATTSAIIQIDTTKYTGATYYFEAVASTTGATPAILYLSNASTYASTSSLTFNSTTATRYRSNAFTPTAGANNYVASWNNAAIGKSAQAIRVIVLQSADPITDTETQIEMGSTASSSDTTTTVLPNPMYWYYDDTKWDGTITASAEVTYQLGAQAASSTIFRTATTTAATTTVPTTVGISYLFVEAWGAGGGGGISTAGGAGGGGGAYAAQLFATSTGSRNTIFLPAGGVEDIGVDADPARFNHNSGASTTQVVADGGMGTSNATAGTGGTTANSTGQIKFAGGNGGVGDTTRDVGGGGGGAGGPDGKGVNVTTPPPADDPTPGGNGDAGSGGAGGAGGTTQTDTPCSTTGGAAGVNHVLGGGGGGGANADVSGVCGGGAGGYPGGGAGSSESTNGDQVGGAGQIKITETHGAVGIALEECDNVVANCVFKAQIVKVGQSTTTPARVRVNSFSLSSGKNYRIVASSTSAKVPYYVYNAKIIIDQNAGGGITKLEPQYLLANKTLAGGIALQNYLTYFDPGEWVGVTNTYIHQATSQSGGSSDTLIQNTSGPATLSGSEITNVGLRATSTTAGITMPGSAATLDVLGNANGGDLYSSRILVQVTPTPPAAATNKISGRVYNDEGTTELTTAGKTLLVRFGTSSPGIFATSTVAANGFWQMDVEETGWFLGMPIHAWIDGDNAFKAFTFTKASSTSNNITGLDLYKDYIIIKHEGFTGTSTTNADLATYDGDDDPDVRLTSVAGGALDVWATSTLYIAPGTHFQPGGAVTLHGNKGGNGDGDLRLATGLRQDGVASSSILSMGSNGITLAGNWFASSSVIFTNTDAVTFNSTSSQQKNIIATSTTFYSLDFNSISGSWTFGSNAATSTNTVTLTNGTVVAPSTYLRIFGNLSRLNNSVFTHNSGTTTFYGSSPQGISSSFVGANAFNNIEFRGAGTKSFGTNAASTTNFTIESGSGAVTAPSYGAGLTISGNYQNDAGDGKFLHNNGIVYFSTTSPATQSLSGTMTGGSAFGTTTFIGSGTKTFSNNASTTAHFTINPGATVVAPTLLTIGGNYTNSGTFTKHDFGNFYFSSTTDQTISGNLTESSQLGTTTFDGAGAKSFGANAASTSNFTVNSTSGTVTFPSTQLTIAGNYTNNGTINANGGTTTLSGGPDRTYSGNMVGSSAFANLVIEGGGGPRTFSNNASTTNLTITTALTVTFPTLFSISGNFISGAGTRTWSTTLFDGASQNISGTFNNAATWFNNAVFLGSGIKTIASNASTTDFTIGSGVTVSAPTLLSIGGNYSNSGDLTDNGGTVFFSKTSTSQTLTGEMTGTTDDFASVVFTGAGTKSFGANPASTTNFTIESSSGDVTAPSTLLSIAGNYTNNANFLDNGGTVYLSGAAQQTLSGEMTGTNDDFNNLTILNTSGTGGGAGLQSVVFAAAASTTGTFTMVASTSAQFLAGATTTFPTLSFGGTSADTRVWLRSSSAGSPWWLVTTGSPTVSYVDVKDSYACGGSTISASNGTNFDSTGNSCWNFVAQRYTLASGRIYSDEGATQLTTAGKTLMVRFGTTTPGFFATSTVAANGFFNITDTVAPSFFLGMPIHAWIDGDAGFKAFTFTKASSTGSAITNLDLYKDYVIVKHEGFTGTSTTNADLATYDGDDDSDIQFRVTGSNLAVNATTSLFIAPGTTFAPGGTVTIHGNGVAAADGNLRLATGLRQDGTASTSILQMDANALTLAGNWFASSSAIFTHSNTVTFNSTSTQQKSLIATSTPFNNLSFNSTGGSWTFGSYPATTTNDFNVFVGTVTAPSTYLYISAQSFTVSSGGNFIHNSGTTTFNRTSGAQTIDNGNVVGADAFNNVEFQGAATKSFGANAASTSNFFIDFTSGAVTAPSFGAGLTIAGNYTNNATFAHNNGIVYFGSTTAATTQTLSGTMTGGSSFGTTTFLSGTKTFSSNASTTAHLTINSGATVVAPALLTVGGNYTDSGTYTANPGSTAVLYFASSTDQTISGNLVESSQLGTTTFSGSGTKTLASNASTTALTIDTGTTLAAPALLSIAGNYANSGNFTDGGGSNTVYFSGSGAQTLAGEMTGTTDDFNHVVFLGGGTKSFGANAASTSNFTIDSTSGAVTLPSTLLTIAGNYTNNASVTDNSGTVYFESGSAQSLSGTMNTSGTDFNNVIFLGAGTKTLGANASTSALTISAGTLDISGRLLTVSGAFTNNSTLTTNATSRLYFTGSGAIAGNLTDTSQLRNVEFLASRSFSNNASTTDFVITTGTVTAPPSGLLSIAGNYTNNGDFADNGGTVYLSGATQQTLSGQMVGTTDDFANLTILNTSGTGGGAGAQSVVFSAAASTTGTFTMVASTSAQFLSGATTTFPTLSFGGTSADTRVWLRSSSAGSPWWLVTTGSPTVSYVDVKDSYACGGSTISASNGTNFDSTGNSCWNFVAQRYTLASGRIYSDEGATQLTTAGKTLMVRFGTTTPGFFATSTVAANGFFNITDTVAPSFFLGMPIHAWIDGDATFKAFTFTKASSTNSAITNLDLYKDYVIVKHEGFTGTSTTNADLAVYDGDDDPDIRLTAVAAGALNVWATSTLYVAPGSEFKPGGTVTLHGNAGGNGDGDLRLATGLRQDGVSTTSILTMGANALTLAGNWFASSTSIFTHTGTVTLNSTSTAQKLIVATSTPFNWLAFNGLSGSWTFSVYSATTTSNFQMLNGSVTAPSTYLSIGTNFTRSGTATFAHNNGTTIFSGTNNINDPMIGSNAFNYVEFRGAGTKSFVINAASTTNFTIASGSGAVTAPSYGAGLTISGNYDNQAGDGKFLHNNGLVYFSTTSPATQSLSGTMTGGSAFGTTTFIGSGTKTFNAAASTTAHFTINSGATVVAPALLTVGGNWTQNGSFTDSGGTVYFSSTTAQTLSGTMNTGTTDFASVVFAGASTKTISSNASTTNFTINSGTTLAAPPLLSIAGNYTNNGTFNAGSGVVMIDGGDQQNLAGTMTDSSAWSSIMFFGSNAKVFDNNASTTNFTNNSGVTVNLPALFSVAGNYTNNGAITSADGTVYFTGATPQTIAGAWLIGTGAFRRVTMSGAGTKSFSNNASTTGLTIDAGATVIAPALLTVGFTGVGGTANYTNNGDFDANGGVVYFGSANPQTLSGQMTGTTDDFNHVIFLGAGTKSFGANAASTTNFTIESSSGDVTAPSTMLSMAGNYTNNANFLDNGGTVYLSGASQQTLSGEMTGTSDDFANLTILNTSGTGATQSVVFAAAASTTGTFTMVASTSAQFLAGATTTLPTLSFGGTSADTRVWLRSSSAGSPWFLVTSGSPTVSYVDVKDSYACGGSTINAYNGTNFDSTGNSCWTFTAPSFLLASGRIYTDEGTTQATVGGRTLMVRFGTTTPGFFATSTVAANGFYQITDTTAPAFFLGMPIHAWIDGDATFRAFTFTKASSTANAITNLDLYKDYVVIKHEGFTGTSTTNADLAVYDGDDDPDIRLTSVAGGTLNVWATSTLYIAPGSEFAPGGAVTLHGNKGSNGDGDLRLATGPRQDGVASSSILTMPSNTLTLAGNFFASSSAIFSLANSVVFNSTSTQQKIIVATTTPFNGITFNGVGGSWTFGINAATTTGGLTLTNGSLTAPSTSLYLGSNISRSGTFIHNSGTITFYGSSAQSILTSMTDSNAFNNIEFRGAGTKSFGANSASTTNFTIASGSGAVTAPSYGAGLTISGNYTNDAGDGKFLHNNGIVYFSTTSPATQSLSGTMTGGSAFGSTTFIGSGTKTFNAAASTTAHFTINSGATVVAPALLTIGGNYTQNGSFTDSGGTVYFSSTTAQTISGTLNTAATDFASVIFDGASTKTISANASTTNFTINSGTTVTAPALLSIAGNYTNNGTFTDGGGTVFFSGSGAQTLAGTMTGAMNDFTHVTFLGGGTKSFGANSASTSNFTVDSTSGAVTLPSSASGGLTIAGNYTNNANVTDNSGTVYFESGSAQSLAGTMNTSATDLNNVIFLGAGTKTLGANASTSALTISAGTLDISSRLLTVAGVFTQNATLTTNATSRIYFSGSGAIAGTLTDTSQLRNVEFLASRSFSNNASTTDFIITTGTVTAPPSGLLSIAGNYTNNGTFTHNAGAVYLSGTGQQTLTGTLTGASAFRDLTILNTSGTGGGAGAQSVIFANAASTTGIFTMTASTSAQFASGAATSSFNGISWNGGSASSPVWLRSSQGGTPWGLVATNTQAVNYVDVKDSYACAGNSINVTNGIDSGGNNCWNFLYSILFSGRVYTDEGTTQLTTAGKTIALRIGTTTPGIFATSTVAANGFWQITDALVHGSNWSAGRPVHVWVDGDAGFKAFTFTKASSSAGNITGLDLYKDRVIIKHEAFNGTSTTNTDLAVYDRDDDSDIGFTSVAGGAFNMMKEQAFYIAPGSEFAPGGTVTLHGNASTTNPDGDLRLATGLRQDGISTSSILTMGANALTLAGNWSASSTSIFTHTGTVTFNSTSTAQKLIVATSSSFSALTLNGVAGSWSFGANTASTSGAFTVTNGTVTLPSTVFSVGGSYTQNGSLSDNGGRVLFDGASQTIAGTMNTAATDFAEVQFLGSGTKTFSNAASTTYLTVSSGVALSAPFQLTIAGNYTNSGIFQHNQGTIFFDSSSAQALAGTMTGGSAFGTTTFIGSGTKTFSNNASTTAHFTINSGATVVAPTLLTVGGNWTQSGLFTDSGGTVYFSSTTNQTIAGTMNTGTTDFASVIFDGASTKTISANASTTNFTINSGTTVSAPALLSIAGNYTQNGTFTDGGGTVFFSGSGAQTLAGTMNSATTDFANVEILGPGTKTLGANASTSVLTVSAGILDISGRLLTVAGAFTNNATLTTNGTSRLYFTGSGNIAGNLTDTSQLRNVEFLASRSFTASASTTGFVISTGTVTAPTTLLTIAGNYTNNGSFTDSGGTVYFESGSAQSLSGTMNTSATDFNTVIFLGAGTKTLGANASTSVLTVSAGTLDISSRLLTVAGVFTQNATLTTNATSRLYFSGSGAIAGTLTDTSQLRNVEFLASRSFSNNASTTDFIITTGTVTAPPSGLLSIAGNYTNNGDFADNSGTVFLSGTSQQTLSGQMTGTADDFANLTILNTSGTGGGAGAQSVIFGAAASTTGTFTMNASTSAQFLAGATTTFPTLSFGGTSAATRVWLRSSSAGSPWWLVTTGSPTVSYVDVKDSYACGGGTITANNGTNFDSTGNSCWTFGGNPTIVSAANQVFTVGDAITAISPITFTDFSTPTITAANDLRIPIATSSVFMLWDSTDLGATFSGTAWDTGKVANPVSYEGGGSVLVIPVSSNFAANETLTISALSFANFATATAASAGIRIFTGGPTDQTFDGTDDKTITIKGKITGAEHAGGQLANQIDVSGVNLADVLLYAFNLTLAGAENMSITNVVVALSGIQGIAAGDVTNAKLYIDYNGNKVIDADDTQVGGAGAVAMSGQTGTITFSSSFTATTTRSYLMKADLANMGFGDGITLALTPSNVTASGLTSLLATTPASSVALSSVQHVKIPRGGGEVGGGVPGGGTQVGGGQGGGELIGDEPGFFSPTATGGTFNQWTTPASGYLSDGAWATADSSWFRQDYGTFGFSVPSANTVTGIEVRLELSSTAPPGGTISVALSWNGGTGTTTTIKISPTLTATDAVITLGSSSDLWGRTWTPAEFSDANFKVRLIAEPSSNTVRVDAIQVKVSHAATGGGQGGGGEAKANGWSNLASVYQTIEVGRELFVSGTILVTRLFTELRSVVSFF